MLKNQNRCQGQAGSGNRIKQTISKGNYIVAQGHLSNENLGSFMSQIEGAGHERE